MQAKMKEINAFKIVGFGKEISCAEEFSAIPKFWNEINERYAAVYAGNEPKNPLEEAVAAHNIGEYGVCIGQENGKTLYIIAGEYKGGKVPNGLTMYELNGGDYAIFDCVGPMPNAIQEVTTKIFKEWLPNNPDYEWKKNITVEWYDFNGQVDAPDYHSAVWLPVQRKAK